MILQIPFTACPGLFYNTAAQDGLLYRLRIPGGIINYNQFQAIADIADNYGNGYIDITNRANIQIREIKTSINVEVLKKLQALGLASTNTKIDHIRNIMTNPTAGIDGEELLDTRPLVKIWEQYITAHSQLCELSAKFSVCFDSGGKVAVKYQPNDIILAAEIINRNVYLRLYLSYGEKGQPAQDTGILLKPEETITALATLAQTYLKHIDTKNRRKLRLREIINKITVKEYLHQIKENLNSDILNFTKTPLCASAPLREKTHIGIYPQRQTGLYYIGIVLPLGRLETSQIRGLANIAKRYGDDNIRLTPWQNLLLTDIPQNQISEVDQQIANLGLNSSPTNIKSFLVACSGKKGCAAAATETKDDAINLAKYLENLMILDSPVNIHFSGCSKSCAQHTQADITLLGIITETAKATFPAYQVYVLGHLLYEYVTIAKIPILIQEMLAVYQKQRLSLHETFGQFIDRHSHQLKQLFSQTTPNLTFRT
ncbi:MAG: precorrin-3B synthase [Aphanizomenon gracile PMC649.10]|jgi:ferredoxin-nitrite reductase|nr:precorrin-3B synthase [Aphanizomenon gracile PMC638.10]MDM3853313.1 precorrin-3B synthase [Aphanizomenon gracile PMC627.10]MDM3855108.1 precorrin-3B synthase [Aphanizomenon gracile PMC649.10]MDM3862881.1 precorrin-3B synthase [Aphanizomenon gracile PMC644.10]